MTEQAATIDRGQRVRQIAVSELILDPRNPRLIVPDRAKEPDLLAKLYEDESLEELYPSFVENGYFEEEPLVVVPQGKKYLVVEGNRRLATLKLLLNPTLRKPANVAGWPILTPAQRRRLTRVPCVVYSHREEVLTYLGFRHITGARKWKPFQRARFVSQLLEGGQSLDQVQEMIGDDASATKKLYQDFVAYTQLVDELGFPAERIRDRFSLLEVMLGQRAIKTHLAMASRLPTHRIDAVVPQDKLEDFQEVATWVFGTEQTPAVIGDSREINARLAPVVKDDSALEYLRRTGDLEGAYERSGGEQEFLVRKMARVERAVQDLSGVVPLHLDDVAVVAGVRRLELLVKALVKQVDGR